ncbi:hypothetical protein [Halalkalicoccus ordinarius]|uniref:hypothetical protein n=1 Tax=Halalkalicoccus ordinarius TaxID=3116651 RepID=UPI00300E8D28
MNRRDLLSAVCAATATGSAGCLSSLGRGDYEEIRLGLVTVSNRSDRDQTVDLLLRRDGETVSWTRHDLRARDGDVIPGDRIGCLLDEPAGAYAVLARLERTGEAFDLPLVSNGHETRDAFLVVTEAETVEPFGPAGPADEERCRNAPVLDALDP